VHTDLAARERLRLSAAGNEQPWAVAPGSSAAGSGRRQHWDGALPPTAVAAAALAAIREDRFYVFTHSGSRARVQARLGPILDALDASEPDEDLRREGS
jgi:hypothetical protein